MAVFMKDNQNSQNASTVDENTYTRILMPYICKHLKHSWWERKQESESYDSEASVNYTEKWHGE